jgi:hypothetical protein
MHSETVKIISFVSSLIYPQAQLFAIEHKQSCLYTVISIAHSLLNLGLLVCYDVIIVRKKTEVQY